jgi:hypothetical protein
MAIRYIRVNVTDTSFTPVSRPTGNLAIIGAAAGDATQAANIPFEVADPNQLPFGSSASDLSKAIQLAARQTPGPSLIFGIRIDPANVDAALTAAATLDVQFVVLANTILEPTPTSGSTPAGTAAIEKLIAHVDAVSKSDGRERMGVVMLKKDATDAGVAAGTHASERMVFVAHRSSQDAAAAVAGTIAGYPPATSMVLKSVSIDMPAQFTDQEIQTINGQETGPPNELLSPPKGQGVIWLVDPPLFPGRTIVMGEGYTGAQPPGKKFIDLVRFLDDLTFKVKARLMGSIGTARVTRSGLRSIVLALESVLDFYVDEGILDPGGYTVTIPVLALLDKDPASLTLNQLQKIKDARDQRVIEVAISVKYAGAVHRIGINLRLD